MTNNILISEQPGDAGITGTTLAVAATDRNVYEKTFAELDTNNTFS